MSAHDKQESRSRSRCPAFLETAPSNLVYGAAGEEFSAIVGFHERANYQGLYVPHLKTLQTHHGIIRHTMLDFIKNKKNKP